MINFDATRGLHKNSTALQTAMSAHPASSKRL